MSNENQMVINKDAVIRLAQHEISSGRAVAGFADMANSGDLDAALTYVTVCARYISAGCAVGRAASFEGIDDPWEALKGKIPIFSAHAARDMVKLARGRGNEFFERGVSVAAAAEAIYSAVVRDGLGEAFNLALSEGNEEQKRAA